LVDLATINVKILLYYRDMKTKGRKGKRNRRSRKRQLGGVDPYKGGDNFQTTSEERSEQIGHDWNRAGLDIAATGTNILSTPGAVTEVLTRQGRNIVTKSLDQSLTVVDKTVVASGKVASSFVEQSGNVGESAINAVGNVGVAGVDVASELGDAALRRGIKPIGLAAVDVAGDLGETALRQGVQPVGTAAIQAVGTQSVNSINFANRIASSAFDLTHDLVDASSALYSGMKEWMRLGQLQKICNSQLNVIDLAKGNINTMQNVNEWTNRVFAEGQREGWIDTKCGWWSCKGRDAIRVVIQSILQTVLFQGENLENLGVLKINLEGFGSETKRIKTDLELRSSDKDTYEDRKTELKRKLEATNSDILQSYNQLALIVGAMKTLAQPNILRLRKGLSDKAVADSLAKMNPRQKELLKGALNVSSEEIQLMEKNKTRADVESEAKATEKEADLELKDEINSVNEIPTRPLQGTPVPAGGRRRKVRRRTKKKYRRRKKERRSRRRNK
jgi:hypothetical protein